MSANLITGATRPTEQSAEDPRFRGKRYGQLVAAFNVYRSSYILAESVALPKIHTAFHGVPFACNAAVLDVGHREVTFSIGRLHAKVVERTEASMIMSPLHGMTFKVMATAVDAERGQASFTQFLTQRRSAAEQRTRLRVEPEQAIYVRMRCLGRELEGSLLDVSVISMAVSFPEVEIENIDEGTPVELFIPELLPESDLSFQAGGTVIRTMPLADENSENRGVVVYLQINHELCDRLERYVAIRRISIIRELNNADSPPGEADDKAASD